MRRAFWVALHRWSGLAMAGFLVVVGLTGSILAFRKEIDVRLNPELLTVASREGAPLDPLELRDRAAALYPGVRIDTAPLRVEPGRSYMVRVRTKGEAGPGPLIFLYLDPHTGGTLGTREWGVVSLDRRNLLFFLYRLHYMLALPGFAGEVGRYLLGVVALIWTIDCLVAFYLTLPPRRRAGGGDGVAAARATRSWWARWRPAWTIRLGAGVYRVNFDIHRAFGLWNCAALVVFAWSGVMFNLKEVYAPATDALFGLSRQADESSTRRAPLENPRLDWRAARDRGRALLDEEGRRRGFSAEALDTLSLDRERGLYRMSARSSRDADARGRVFVDFDADTGALRRLSWSGRPDERAGDVVSRWLGMLHTASVFGLPYRIYVCVVGFIVTTLSITGVYIWWKKRKARRFRKSRGSSRGAPMEA